MSDPDSNPKEKPPVITYVLAGYDPHASFTSTVAKYANQPNTVILSHAKYKTLDDAIKAIKGPARLIVACHGGEDAVVSWQDGPLETYQTLFKAMEHSSIDATILLSCYGESAMTAIKNAPAGMVVIPLIGKQAPSNTIFNDQFADKTAATNDITDYVLEVFDNVNPKEYFDALRSHGVSNVSNASLYEVDPKNLLPETIGIGGNPAQVVHLDDATKAMKNPPVDKEAAFSEAIARVQQHFGVSQDMVQYKFLLNDMGILPARFDKLSMSQQET